MDNYLTAQKDTIFANVAVLIYVFDITTTEWENDLRYFDEILTALRENSSDAGVWVLINKMDLVDKEDPKRKKFEERKTEIMGVDERIRKEQDVVDGSLQCFPTSIWDESLYKVSGWCSSSKPLRKSTTMTLKPSITPGVVVGHPHFDPQHRTHHLASHLFARPVPGH